MTPLNLINNAGSNANCIASTATATESNISIANNAMDSETSAINSDDVTNNNISRIQRYPLASFSEHYHVGEELGRYGCFFSLYQLLPFPSYLFICINLIQTFD